MQTVALIMSPGILFLFDDERLVVEGRIVETLFPVCVRGELLRVYIVERGLLLNLTGQEIAFMKKFKSIISPF